VAAASPPFGQAFFAVRVSLFFSAVPGRSLLSNEIHMRPTFITPILVSCLVACAALVAFTFKANNKHEDKTNSVATAFVNPPGYQWTKLTEQANFAKSYNFQLFSLNNKLWAFHPDGNYFTSDGKIWMKSSLPNSIHNLAFLDYVRFNNAVYGLGHFTGNSENYNLDTRITQTTDLIKWNTVAAESNLPKRFFYHPFVFNNRIWIIGGSDGVRAYNDAWSSPDAIHWTKEADQLPFTPGNHFHVLDFKGKLLLLDNNKVWSSTDAIHWTKLTDKIVDADMFGYTPVVFDEKLWLLGCNRNQQFSTEILVSSDGIHFEAQDAPWSPRGGVAAAVYNDKLYITGGKYGGFKEGTTETEFVYSNDVWCLEKTH
jgi:hypothetical protein